MYLKYNYHIKPISMKNERAKVMRKWLVTVKLRVSYHGDYV
jgi:hypothetical protein